jgi:hypothetical protein
MIPFAFLLVVLGAAFRRRLDVLFGSLMVSMALFQLPSALKELTVLSTPAGFLYCHDIVQVVLLLLLVVDGGQRQRLSRYPAISFWVIALLLYHLLGMGISVARFGAVESSYIRQAFLGVLWFPLLLIDFSRSTTFSQQVVGRAFLLHNLVVLLGVVSLLVDPTANDINSPLASYLGFSSDDIDQGGFILVTAPSASLAIISIWYSLFVLRLLRTDPRVVLAILAVAASAHRIAYLALLILLVVHAGYRRSTPFAPTLKSVSVAWLGLYAIAFSVFAVQYGDVILQFFIIPTVDRALSLFVGTQQVTVAERVGQYSYFFTDYLLRSGIDRILLGESYLPPPIRDSYYQYAQPHNLVLGSIVSVGLLGLLLMAAATAAVLLNRVRQRRWALLPLMTLLITQLTDAGFTEFPSSALFPVLLGMALHQSVFASSI